MAAREPQLLPVILLRYDMRALLTNRTRGMTDIFAHASVLEFLVRRGREPARTAQMPDVVRRAWRKGWHADVNCDHYCSPRREAS